MSSLKSHPNIVSCEDYEVIPHDDERGWDILIRMELLTSLMNYQKQHTMDVQTVKRMGMELADALEYCEGKGLIHRDIKPENIFVSETGAFKLGDFGVARSVEKTTGGMSKKGTESYMAPEVYKGQPYNATVDIYSLGLVLYRYLNGNRLPFFPPAPKPITYLDRENALAMRMKGAAMPLPSGCDEALGRAVLKACAYDPKERFQSGAEMADALRNGLQEEAPGPAEEEYDDLGVGLGAEDSLTIGIWGNRPKETTNTPSTRPTDDFRDHSASQREYKEEEEHTIGIWGKQPEIISGPKPETSTRPSQTPKPNASSTRPAAGSGSTKPPTSNRPLFKDDEPLPEPEKKSKKGKAVGIVIAIALVLSVIGIIAENNARNSTPGYSSTSKSSYNTSSKATSYKPPIPSGKTSQAESSKTSQTNSSKASSQTSSKASSQTSHYSYSVPSNELVTPGRLIVASSDYYFDGSNGKTIIQEIADILGLTLVWVTYDPSTIETMDDYMKIQADLICISIVDDETFIEEQAFQTYLSDYPDVFGNILYNITEYYYHRIQSEENGYYYHNCFITPKSEVLNHVVSDISYELYYSGVADAMWG